MRDSIATAEEGGGAATSPCPFLVAGEAEADVRCRAVSPPWSPPRQQRRLLCTTPFHGDCPFALRARQVIRPPIRTSVAQTLRQPPVLAAALVFIVAAGLALVAVLGRGGLGVAPGGWPQASAAAVGEAPSPRPAGSTLTETPGATASPTLPSIPTPSGSATPVVATAGTRATASPSAALARWLTLPPCPDRPECRLYTVRAGDTLSQIARRFASTVARLVAENPEVEPNLIHPGETIRIPRPAS